MKNINKSAVLIFISLCLTFLTSCSGKKVNAEDLPLYPIHASIRPFESEAELAKEADLIVIGSVVTTLDKDKPIIHYSESGRIGGYATLSRFRVDKVLYGEFKKKRLSVLQGIVITDRGDGVIVKLTTEGYKELSKNDLYILYLKDIKSYYTGDADEGDIEYDNDSFVIIGRYHGVINLSDDVTRGVEDPFSVERMQNIKSGVLERFKDEIAQVMK